MAKTYPKSVLQELLWDGWYNAGGIYVETVKDEIVDTSRWSIHHEIIFRDINEDKYYSVSYSKGATEMQEESPFDDEPDDVEVSEVTPIKQIVTTYGSGKPTEFAKARTNMLTAIEEMISLKEETEKLAIADELLGDMSFIQGYAIGSHEGIEKLILKLYEQQLEKGDE